MREILFGWVTKGRCDISILDGVIFFTEVITAALIFSFFLSFGNFLKRTFWRMGR